jgi:hypothetical protein
MIFCLGTHPTDGRDDGANGPAPQDGGAVGDGSTDGEGGTMILSNTCALMPPSELPSGGGDGGACADCTNNNCSLQPSPDGTDGCCALSSAADQVLCLAAAQCFTTNKCTTGGDPIRCFCGSSGTDCYVVPNAANGPCVGQVIAAAKQKDPATIMSLFSSSASPLGRAVNLLGCRGSFCSMECGIR